MPLPTHSPPRRAAEAALPGGRGAAGWGGGQRLPHASTGRGTLPSPPHTLSPAAPVPAPFGLQAPKPFGGFGVKVLPVLHRQAVGVSFEWRGAPSAGQLNMRHLPKNTPGRVLPALDSPGFAPLMLLASPKDRKVWGLAGLRARASREPPPCMVLDAHGGEGSWRGAMVPPEPTPCSGGGLRLCGAADGHPDPKSTRGGQCAALLGPIS